MFYEPMLPEAGEAAFDSGRYLFEPKIDGHRMLLSMINGKVNLYTRFRTNITERYPELLRVPVDSPHVVLDGEAAYLNPETGDFERESVMERLRLLKPARIRDGARRLPVRYFVFDILSYDGEDVRHWPLDERKALLNDVLEENESYSRVLSVEGTGKGLFEAVRQRRLEGLVAKRKDSLYTGGGSDDWLKIINYLHADVTVVGYRKSQFGWLIHMNGKPAGVLEQGVPLAVRRSFQTEIRDLIIGEDRDYVYLKPAVQARIRFLNRYKSGTLRAPEFIRFLPSLACQPQSQGILTV
ncbi:ATP-dependent DNA ligase [Paenibacillus sp. 598K]|uniref:ATP-dependent DNA ligase n=1 Tax=Paenibacillus sp. 598K TaxID=1117987 RepID=UPI001624652B|nr:RNA ligase family protein [Paenibacillus sp. 598K]